jgi:surface antigen
MKRWFTTPVSTSFSAKLMLGISALVLVVAGPIQMTSIVKADQYDDQINAIQREIDQYEAAAGNLQNIANDLQQKIQSLDIEKAQIQAQVDLSQLKYDQLQAQIAQTEKDIATNKSVLGDTIANLYIDGTVSPLEMLASSKNIGDYVDKQAYQSSVRDELTNTIKKIQTLKKQLEKQKSDTEKVLLDQKNARDALAAKEAEQQAILNETKGQQAAYQQLSADRSAKQAQIREQQQAAILAAINRTGGARLIATGVDGNYTWNTSNCPMMGYFSTGGADGNGGDGYGYGCRQCASYAAWRVARETGYYPYGWGNATNFPANARAAGYQTGYTARAGSLGVMHSHSAGVPEGHVVWVETDPDNGQIIVSQYNYNYGSGYGMYSKMQMSVGAFDEFVYIK